MGNKQGHNKASTTATKVRKSITRPHSAAITQTTSITVEAQQRPQTRQEAESERKQRLANALADTLLTLSLDLIGICVDYIGFSYPAAVKDAKPKLLSEFTSPERGFHDGCYCIAISPDGHVWVSRASRRCKLSLRMASFYFVPAIDARSKRCAASHSKMTKCSSATNTASSSAASTAAT